MLADIAGDDRPDVVAAGELAVRIARGRGDGAFAPSTLLPIESLTRGASRLRMWIAMAIPTW